MEYPQWEELRAEFDELVEGMEVVPDMDYSDLPDVVFLPMVEMLRTLAHLAPSLTPAQLEDAKRVAVGNIEAVRTGAHQRCLGIAADGI